MADEQTVGWQSQPGGGTFVFSMCGRSTAPIPYNATIAQMQAACDEAGIPIIMTDKIDYSDAEPLDD